MKFDIVIGNPPFSKVQTGKKHGKGGEKLYAKFFELAIGLSDVVAMVLPSSGNKVDKKHNGLLKKYANVIKNIDNSTFPIILDTWYVICDKSNKTKPDIEWAISDEPRNNIPWQRGSLPFGILKNTTSKWGDTKPKRSDDITVYHVVNKTKGLVTLYGRKDQIPEKHLFPKHGYAVLMPQCFGDKGWSKVEIVKCEGNQAAYGGMNIVFTKTEEQAKRLVDYMKTQEFITEANKVKQGFMEMSIPCFRSIPIEHKMFQDLI